MRETLESSEGRKMNLIENVHNFRDVLNICKDCPEFSSILRLKDEEKMKGSASLSGKLTALGNEYHDIFDFYNEENPDNEEEFNEWRMDVQKFLVELGKIFDEMVVPGSKGKNQIVDGFVKEMFRLNDSFYELNRDIKKQTASGISLNDGSYDNHDYVTRFNFAEMYETIIRDFDAVKENNKHLGIIVYYPLLKLMDEELKKLLGVLEERKIPTEEEFKELSKSLFISDFLNIKTYKDFCDNYDILKSKQRDLFNMKQLVEECFDEEGNLKSDLDLEGLHMTKLRKFLRIDFMDLGIQMINQAKQRISKILGKKNK